MTTIAHLLLCISGHRLIPNCNLTLHSEMREKHHGTSRCLSSTIGDSFRQATNLALADPDHV
jgi:hypothetical protein